MSGGSINIMEICYNSAHFSLCRCRRRYGFLPAENTCLHAEMENPRAENRAVIGLRSRRTTKRKRLFTILALEARFTSLG